MIVGRCSTISMMAATDWCSCFSSVRIFSRSAADRSPARVRTREKSSPSTLMILLRSGTKYPSPIAAGSCSSYATELNTVPMMLVLSARSAVAVNPTT